jgi:hypothetical protein
MNNQVKISRLKPTQRAGSSSLCLYMRDLGYERLLRIKNTAESLAIA